MRKYDLTPILLTNPTVPVGDPFGQDISMPPYQSAQNKGQFIFSRFKDVSSEDTFYSYLNPDGQYVINLDTAENFYGGLGTGSSANVGDFVWGGSFFGTTGTSPGSPTTIPTAGYTSSDMWVHVEHPMVASWDAYSAAYVQLTNDTSTVPSILPSGTTVQVAGNPGVLVGPSGSAEVIFRQSKFAPLQAGSLRSSKKQNIYINEDVVALETMLGGFIFGGNTSWPSVITIATPPQTIQPSPSLDYPGLTAGPNTYSRNAKSSFSPLDQYLLGKPSCGSYLFMATEQHENIQVSGDATLSTKPIKFGSNNSLNVPLIFQYRMTDYFGQGSGSTGGGRGNIAGDDTGATVNVTYAKRLGFDIFKTVNDVYQYDIEIFATYRSDQLNIELFPSATIQKSLIDLEKVVANLSPSITQTKVNKTTTSTTSFEDTSFNTSSSSA
jgi:hypothetical protein